MSKKSNILAKIKELFAEEKMAMDYTTIDCKTIRCMGSEGLKIGEAVREVVEEQDLADGNYELNDGKILSISAGEIKEIKEVEKDDDSETGTIEEKMGKNMGEPNVIKEKMEGIVETKLMDGTEVRVMVVGDTLAIGDKVEVKDAEGNFVKAPEGRHETIDGLVIYVDAEGLINEIETEDTRRIAEMKEMFEAISKLTDVVSSLKEKFEKVSTENTELKEIIQNNSKNIILELNPKFLNNLKIH